MKPLFNEAKAAQLAAVLLGLRGGPMHYMKLIKLMYLTDREALISWGRPLTYDSYVSMPHGPVLSSTLDLINDGPDNNLGSPWANLIVRANDPCCVALGSDDFSTDELSDAEEEIIGQVYKKFGHMNRYALGRLLHEILPEWRDPAGSALPIEYKDILAAAGKSPQEIAEVESELNSVAMMNALTLANAVTTHSGRYIT